MRNFILAEFALTAYFAGALSLSAAFEGGERLSAAKRFHAALFPENIPTRARSRACVAPRVFTGSVRELFFDGRPAAKFAKTLKAPISSGVSAFSVFVGSAGEVADFPPAEKRLIRTRFIDVRGRMDLIMPVPRGALISRYGRRIHPFTKKPAFHDGVDFAAPRGSTIVAARRGLVVRTSRDRIYGLHVVLDHGFGYRSIYAHLRKIEAVPGEVVRAGQRIGQVGSTGRSTGPHLHFEVRGPDDEPLRPFLERW